ncbi:DNRLRE domain-containing protein [Nonomuraea wenchangensis]
MLAKKGNQRVEIESLRSENATYYANPDGKTLRMELHLQPIRVKNAKGDGFVPIDTTLVETDGVVKPKAAKGDLALSPGADTTAIRTKTGAISAQIDAPRKLPKPELKGSSATYPSAYGKGIDLVVTATPTGFRQQIVIRERPAGPVAFRVPMDLPKGLFFGENAEGRPMLKSEDGKRTLVIRPAPLLDAVAADPNGDLSAVKVGKAPVSLDGSTLVYKPDQNFLADLATTYPVTMVAPDDDWWDCTLGDCPDGVGESMDTYINDVDLTESWDTFTRDQMWVGKSYASNIAKRWRGYIQFPMPRAGDPFWGSKIQNADLELWNYLSNDCGQFVGSGITARQIISDWDELTLSWSDQPSVTSVGADTEYGAYSTDCSGSMNYEHDLVHSVNTIVQEWANGKPNYGFQLTAGNESELRNWRRYRTREQTAGYPAHGPRLTVDFEPPRTPVSGALLMSPDEARPTTMTELNAWAARGRVSNTLPEPAPVTYGEDLEYRAATDQEVTTSTDALQTPLPAPDEGVTARWPFSEASGSIAADVSGNNHTATVNNGVAWTPGVSNSALTNVGVTGGPNAAPEAESLQPARVAASQQAATRKTAVEVVEETTESSVTHAFPDGSFRKEIATGPVRTRRGESWVPIDTSLTAVNGKLHPKAIAEGAVVEISAGGTDPFVKMSADGKSYALRWPTPLPKPMVKGSVATYTDAAGTGSDLVVTALPTGFRHEVVLRQRPSKPLELRIGVEDEGLTLSEGKAGRLLLKGKDKKLVASAPQPVMWDGSAKGRRPLAKSSKVDTDVATKDGRTELVLKPDQRFLADSATAYPVRILPMAVSTSSEDIMLASTDTVDWPAFPGNPVMIAGVQQGQKMRSYLRFPTGNLQGQTVTDAKVSLYNIQSSACGTSVGDGLQVRRVSGAWDVNNLHWANKPAATTEDAQINKAGYDYTCAGGAQRLEWNVTGIAQDWAAGAADHGLVVQSPTEGTTTNWRYLTASEDTDFNQPPTLTITTSGPVSEPVVSNLAITPAQTVGGVAVTSSLTPQLAATVTDTAAGRLNGEFEVEHDPAATGQGSGQIWAGASQVVASGGQAAVNVPAGKLADGWKIRWRARAANATASTTSAWSAWQTATVDVPNPTVGAFQVTPSQMVDGVTVATSLTPALRTTAADPAAQPVRAEFELEHDPAATGQGTGQIWAGAVDNVTSGTQGTVTVPSGKLTDGWKVRWRVRAVNTATTVSSPWSDWQVLTIDVSDPASEPTVGALQVSPSQQVDGTTVTPTLTPALLAQVSNPIGGALRAEFEVEHDPAASGQGTGQIWASAVDNVASGTQASVAVPAGKLADKWKLRWRARAVAGEASSQWSDWQLVTVELTQTGNRPLAQTSGPVVNTDQSFTVAAWVKWNDNDAAYTVLEQRGTYQAPFRLGNDPDRGLVFTFTSADTANPTVEGVFSNVDAPVNEWFHLAAVYTQNPSTATLYLDGRPIGSSALSSASWKSTGPLTLGTAMTGSLDEVWVYGHDLIDNEVFALMDGSPSAPSAVASTASQNTMAVAATGRYDRIKPEDCWKDHGWRKRTYGLNKNRFSGCTLHAVSVFSGTIGSDKDGIDVDASAEWLGQAMFVAKTFSGKEDIDAGATTRDMWFDLYVGHAASTGIDLFPDDDVDLTIGMRPAADQTACRDVTTFQGATQRNHLTMEVEDWIEAADATDDGKWSKLATFRFRADPAHAPAKRSTRTDQDADVDNTKEKISNCVFKPYVQMRSSRHVTLFEYGTISEKTQITCDSARYINEWSGGCTLPVVPSIEWKMGGGYDIAYKHYWKACYQSTDTYPKDSTKSILGCAIGGTTRPDKSRYLWRISDPAGKNNNARAKTRCNALWPTATWPAQECDEYPFASSGTRTAAEDAERNFSVCSMPKSVNGEAGKALTRLFNRDRVLYEQDFFNRFATQLTSVESMKDLCFDPIATTGTALKYLNDQPKD